ncbi:MAG: Radical protein [Thermodesulfobacteriota bacterium]|nr:Radical protein [Thermodesulfobacteriota bacterium]
MNGDTYVIKKNLSGILPHAQLDIELTERCNNSCIHCSINLPAGDKISSSRELDTDGWKNILRQAADLGFMTVRITGGEPLLRHDFSELYIFARLLGLKVLLFTNARLITSQIADMLADTPPLEYIEVSVYGMKKESYEAVTGVPGSYAGFRNGIQSLLDRKIPFVVKGALLPPNKNETREFKEWAATIPWMEGTPPVCSMFFDLRVRRDSALRNSIIYKLRVSPDEAIMILTEHPESYRREMAEFFDRFASPSNDRLFTCGIGPACVDAYGTLQPCMALRLPDLTYDLKKGSLKEALTSVFPRMREMRAENPLYLERCARCFLKPMCDQCPAKSWSEHGTLDTPVEYFCKIAHSQALFLGLIKKGEEAWMVRDSEERIKDYLQKSR